MKFIHIIFYLLVLISFNSISYSEKFIELKIINSETNAGIDNVHIHVKCLDCVKDTVVYQRTDSRGIAKVPNFKTALISATKVSFERYYDTLDLTTPTLIKLSEKKIVTDEVIVTGALGNGTVKNSVFPVKIINQDKIISKGASNLQELLNTETNIEISQDNILGAGMSVNGISGQNVKILVDGIPVIGRLDGNIDISQINLNNIERIEIVEGPMSARYGSNALGGVINLISKKGGTDKFQLSSNFKYETVGRYNADISADMTQGKSKFGVLFGRNIFQGFGNAEKGIDNRNNQWDPKLQYFGGASFQHSTSDYMVKLKSNIFDEFILNRGTPEKPYKETAFDDEYRTFRSVNSMNLENYFTDDNHYDMVLAYSYYKRNKNRFFTDLTTLDRKLTTVAGDQDTTVFTSYLFQSNYYYKPEHKSFNMMLGLDFNFDYSSGRRIAGNDDNINDYAIFTSAKYLPIDGLILQPSLRYIYNTKYDAPILPALNIKYDFVENLVMRISYGRGFRSPSLKELYFLFVDSNHKIYGNDSLKAEQSDSYNLSLKYDASAGKNYFYFEAKSFFNVINDKIELTKLTDSDSGPYKNKNIGRYETVGGVFSYKYIRENLLFNFSYSLLGTLNRLYEEPNQQRYNFSTDFSFNFDYSLKEEKTKVNLFYKYTGKKYQFDSDLNQYIMGDYHILDLSVNKIWNEGMFNTTFGIKNLLNIIDVESSVKNSSAHSGSDTNGGISIATGRTLFFNINIKL